MLVRPRRRSDPMTTAAPQTSAPALHEATPEERDHKRGLIAAFAAFSIWGLMPAYLRPLASVDAMQIMANRALWCCVVTLGWLSLRGELSHVRAALASPAIRGKLAITALCASTNWLLYVWGVTHGHVVETSLGYFINPLVNVVLGVVVLRESLRRGQWIAVAIAAAGVAYLTWQAGRPPYIALTLAATFGLYGLLRKTIAVDALAGLGAETLLIAPFVAVYLVWSELSGTAALGHAGPMITALLLAGGVLTAVPLALFSFGARRIPYSSLGLLQFVGPTLQMLLGITLYGEHVTAARLVGFALIWVALALYVAEGSLHKRALGPAR
jgi:chloramphenicol-sensitive protein RarD